MRGRQRLAFIPGFVHSFVVGWICDTVGATRTGRHMGWTRHRLDAAISGAEPLRAHEVERLMSLFASVVARELEGEEGDDGEE